MKINMINGSQKPGESNSGIILDSINELIKEEHEVRCFKFAINNFTDEMLKEAVSADVIVLAFPLFVDAIPSHTLKMLVELENTIKHERTDNLIIYTIINCGFFEGKQNLIAFEMIRHWCDHYGIQFGGGIGLGGGEMFGEVKNIPMNKGPFNNLARALQVMKESMELRKPFEIMYLNPCFPRFLFKFMANRGWHSLAYKNGLKKKDLRRSSV